MAIPLGAVNPRIGRSGDLLIAGLIAMLYMNLINITQGWIIHGKLRFVIGVWLIRAIFGAFKVVALASLTRQRTQATGCRGCLSSFLQDKGIDCRV